MLRLKKHINLALGYFIMAALLGAVLRAFHSIEIPLTYKFIVHTHSHIALLGWVYVGLTTLFFKVYLQQLRLERKYLRIFWFTQLTLVGMLITFPMQGYGLFSITFSTLFLFASYWFAGFFIKNVPTSVKHTKAYKCMKWALWYMVLSSLGPWALGGIMNTLGAESVWYRMAIYFYLHFQYNGWMVLGLLGLLFHLMEQNGSLISKKGFKQFLWSMNSGIVLTFFLSTLWADPPALFYVLGGLGAVFQILAFGLLLRPGLKLKKVLDSQCSSFQKKMFVMLAILFGVKIILQLMTSLPYFAKLTATITDFTIGYLHWTFLGVVSLGLFLFMQYHAMLQLNKRTVYLYLLGFVATEVLIFGKGIVAWLRLPLFKGYFDVLTVASLLIPLALVLFLANNLKAKK